jgi:hypothetical protein
MRGWSVALGVRCAHCHVGGNPDTLEGFDFASDAKWEKRTARAMARMVGVLNADYIGRLEPRSAPAGPAPPTVRVECATCHRGVLRPETIEAVLWRGIEESGPEAALRNYKELRTKYLGRGSYDFSNGPVNMVGERLLAAHRWREALPLLEFNAESHPDASWSVYLLGEARLAGGDGQSALFAFEKAVALDPGNGPARRRVDELRLTASPKP